MKKECFSKDEWFFEENGSLHDTTHYTVGIRIKKKLFSGKSPYQRIDFYDSYDYGRILVLDGVVQLTEKDEFIYHEMLCQVPLFLQQKPKRVLIIGGGDGGSLREVLKHQVEKAYLVEIDKKIVELSKKYLPTVSQKAFKDKRTEIVIADGIKFVKEYKNFFDLIILDLTDPTNVSKDLVSLKFYQEVREALKEKGIVSIQSGSFTCQEKLVISIYQKIKKLFPCVEIRKAVVPSYHAGEYSFILGSKADLTKISLKDIERKYKKLKLNLKYYYPEIHFSSKVLPKYLQEKIK